MPEEDQRTSGELRGFIFRTQLLTLLLTKSFTPPQTTEDVHKMLEVFRKYENSPIFLQVNMQIILV